MQFVVGAYAALPPETGEQDKYYQLLSEQNWILGAEIPFPGNLGTAEQREWYARQLPASWKRNVVTTIPGTMQAMAQNPVFGLASPDQTGRTQALAFFKGLNSALAEFAQLRGSNDITHIQLHSAPTEIADAAAFKRSLTELLQWDWMGTKLVIEHCDCFVPGQEPAKGFLDIETEIRIAAEVGVGITVNWGRSAIEGRSAQTPVQHIQLAKEAGVLSGLMFSGTGNADCEIGSAWHDIHLPLATDVPASVMGEAEVQAALRVATGYTSAAQVRDAELEYLGVKIMMPAGINLRERVELLQHIYQA